jgi:protoheme IX farnesyltransferase
MKATAEPLTAAATADKSLVAVLADLVKARLTFLVLLTTLVGFYMGTVGPVDYTLLCHALAGTALLACGASALNQLWEREHDALMRRTADRPLPSGRLQPDTVLIFGGLCSVVGLVYLAAAVNPLTSFLGAVTLVSYVFIYTPLKRVTWLNTVVGAVPGAVPPVMGWTAARGELTSDGWPLFAILFFWQMPHFLAIAWLYRDEYAKAGFVMLPAVDPEGVRTGRLTVSHTIALMFVSLLPAALGLAGTAYFLGAAALGLVFLALAFQFSRQLTLARARRVFFVSIVYLPLLLGLMVLDKLKH